MDKIVIGKFRPYLASLWQIIWSNISENVIVNRNNWTGWKLPFDVPGETKLNFFALFKTQTAQQNALKGQKNVFCMYVPCKVPEGVKITPKTYVEILTVHFHPWYKKGTIILITKSSSCITMHLMQWTPMHHQLLWALKEKISWCGPIFPWPQPRLRTFGGKDVRMRGVHIQTAALRGYSDMLQRNSCRNSSKIHQFKGLCLNLTWDVFDWNWQGLCSRFSTAAKHGAGLSVSLIKQEAGGMPGSGAGAHWRAEQRRAMFPA